MRFLSIAILSSFLIVTASCKKAAPEVHTTTGVIREIQSQGRILVIEHKAFPGWMEGMTMPFELKDAKLAEGLKTRDAVEFTVSVEENGAPITAIKKMQP